MMRIPAIATAALFTFSAAFGAISGAQAAATVSGAAKAPLPATGNVCEQQMAQAAARHGVPLACSTPSG